MDGRGYNISLCVFAIYCKFQICLCDVRSRKIICMVLFFFSIVNLIEGHSLLNSLRVRV
jgi:hypothetical protein